MKPFVIIVHPDNRDVIDALRNSDYRVIEQSKLPSGESKPTLLSKPHPVRRGAQWKSEVNRHRRGRK